MATDRNADEVLLNALVDGEAAPAEQAAAAARLRTDKDFARAYATLTKLKAVIAEEAAATDLPPIALAQGPRPQRWFSYAAAAVIALAVGGGALSILAPYTTGPAQPIAADAVRAIPVTFAGDPVIPDLSPAGLQLARTVVSAASGVQSLVATYLGPRGCRLELWVSNRGAPAASSRGTGRKTWQVGELVYELIAFGMPGPRFAKIAALAERETRVNRLPEDAKPLIQARIPRPPCLT